MSTRLEDLPVVVIGAGPVGLAAAAHLAERGLPFIVLEAGDGPAAAVAPVGPRAAVLARGGTTSTPPPAACSQRRRLGRARPRRPADRRRSSPRTTCSPLADLPALKPHIRYGARVVAVTRARPRPGPHRRPRDDPVPDPPRRRRGPARPRGHRRLRHLEHAQRPRRLRHPRPRRDRRRRRCIEHALPDVLGADRDRFAGQRTLVVGAGHSAANTLLVPRRARRAGARHQRHLGDPRRPARPAPTAARPPTPCPPAARSAPGCASTSTPAASQLVTGFSVHALTPLPDGAVRGVRRRPNGRRRPDRVRDRVPPRPLASPPSCASTSTRSWAPPGRWPR